ncbi:hypothetical protein GCM10009584_12430 [Ornithinimicrobium humiphilum]|uniref:Beta-lactamase n=1 Tax=Ornithinimicrobium humiphilum TaxID=125288 RepID=A0A543KJU2_9MICO|nr:serine hydrolase domain-containing protein [Ornithinimicrobium humiphilum]TQM95345.1 beta-lactamase [Ornithinimicrobium humiphilum]
MSVVPVYSIAKSSTAAAALLSFDPEAPVGTVLPDLPSVLARLTFRDLLSHRSGLEDYAGWPDYGPAVAARETPWPVADVLGRARVGEPGRFVYSNIGYLLVRLALETKHGTPFFEVLDDLVLGPLGIQAWPFSEPEDWDHCDHPAIDDSLRRYHLGWVYTGTFAAEPDEAARGIALILQGRLGADVAAAMKRTMPVDVPADDPFAPTAGYGLGLMTHGIPVSAVGHGGGGPGFSLFAAASADGTRWRGEVGATERPDEDLVRRCLEAVANPA